MSKFLWSRHSNPWSVWTAVVAYPLLVLALYRRSVVLGAGVLMILPVGLLILRPPAESRSWATRVVVGEQVWLARGALPSREAALAAASAPVYFATFAAALTRARVPAALGVVASLALMLVFFERMVRLADGADRGG